MNFTKYYEEICRYPFLSKEEERDLFLELSDEALPESHKEKLRERILSSNLRFVFKKAKIYSDGDLGMFEELISAGNEGLLVGLQKFDPTNGVRFLSYAGWWVHQRMMDHMSNVRLVKLPVWKQQVIARIQKHMVANPESKLEDICRAFPDVKARDIEDLIENRYLTFYIEDIGDDPAFEINPIETEVHERLDAERISKNIEALPEPHRTYIKLSFGMNAAEEEMSHHQISEEMGLSKTQLKTLRKEALAMLKESMGG